VLVLEEPQNRTMRQPELGSRIALTHSQAKSHLTLVAVGRSSALFDGFVYVIEEVWAVF
jgi:hypothetical protein